MKHGPPMIVRVIVIIAVLSAIGYWFFFVREVAPNGRITASGTIEATEVHISAETGGRVADVLVDVGDTGMWPGLSAQGSTTSPLYTSASRASTRIAPPCGLLICRTT